MHVHLDRPATTAAVIILSLAVAGYAQAATDMTDGWITTKVKMSLLTNEGVSASGVNVDTIDGRVTLHGTVSSEAEKARAERLAASVEGVLGVNNLLQVTKRQTPSSVQDSDVQLEERVSAALKADLDLANSRIVVQSVNAGVVLLSGRAASLSDVYRAVRVATGVDGVRRVVSEIESPDEVAQGLEARRALAQGVIDDHRLVGLSEAAAN